MALPTICLALWVPRVRVASRRWCGADWIIKTVYYQQKRLLADAAQSKPGLLGAIAATIPSTKVPQRDI
jgi:hypothetical protein